MSLLWVCGAPVVYFPACVEMTVKADGHNTVNKPDNMMNKPTLVHFKTGVGYFPLAWETRIPNLLVTFLICGFGFSNRDAS